MISNTSALPDNPEELKKLIEQMQSSHLAELEKLKGRHEAEVRLLQEALDHGDVFDDVSVTRGEQK